MILVVHVSTFTRGVAGTVHIAQDDDRIPCDRPPNYLHGDFAEFVIDRPRLGSPMNSMTCVPCRTFVLPILLRSYLSLFTHVTHALGVELRIAVGEEH